MFVMSRWISINSDMGYSKIGLIFELLLMVM